MLRLPQLAEPFHVTDEEEASLFKEGGPILDFLDPEDWELLEMVSAHSSAAVGLEQGGGGGYLGAPCLKASSSGQWVCVCL